MVNTPFVLISWQKFEKPTESVVAIQYIEVESKQPQTDRHKDIQTFQLEPSVAGGEGKLMLVKRMTATGRMSLKCYRNLSMCKIYTLTHSERLCIPSNSPRRPSSPFPLYFTVRDQEHENWKRRKSTKCFEWMSSSGHNRHRIHLNCLLEERCISMNLCQLSRIDRLYNQRRLSHPWIRWFHRLPFQSSSIFEALCQFRLSEDMKSKCNIEKHV